ncbi:ParA family protein [Ursidibacter arcticus]
MNLLQNTSGKPFVITVASTKGGSAKSTNAANIGAFCAEHGLKTLLIDTDTQPTLSSYYALDYQAPGGTYEFLHFRDVEPSHIISKTTIPNLDLIQSNDPSNKISPMLRDSPDGALRFSLLLSKIEGYDVVIVDTRGTRGTIGMYQDLQTFANFGFKLPPLKAVINCVDHTNDVKFVSEHLHALFATEFDESKTLLDFAVPDKVAYREAATFSVPVYQQNRTEYKTIQQLCSLLMPQFAQSHFMGKE